MTLLTKCERPRIPSRTVLDGLETGSHRQIFTRPVASRKWCLFCSGHSEEISAEARNLKRIIPLFSLPSLELTLSESKTLYFTWNYWVELLVYHRLKVFSIIFTPTSGFPSGSVVKNLLANAGDTGDTGLIPRLGRSTGGGNGNPLQ